MKIYTGYYGGLKHYTNLCCVSISLYQPRWLQRFPVCRVLAPKPWILKLKDDPEKYTEEYHKLLQELDPVEIIRWLESISEGKDVVLLCYEKPGQFCHRRLVANWLKETLELEILEYEIPS